MVCRAILSALLLFRVDSRASVINLLAATDSALDVITKSGVDGVGFVLFSDALVDGALAASFFRVAERLHGRASFFEAPSSLASSLGVLEPPGGAFVARVFRGSPTVLLRSLSDAKAASASAVVQIVDDPSALNTDDARMLGWVLHHRYPPLIRLSKHNYPSLVADGRLAVILFNAEDGSEATRAASFAIEAISDSLATTLPSSSRDKFLFATCAISKAKRLALQFNVGAETTFIVLDAAGKRFWSDETVSELEDLETWCGERRALLIFERVHTLS